MQRKYYICSHCDTEHWIEVGFHKTVEVCCPYCEGINTVSTKLPWQQYAGITIAHILFPLTGIVFLFGGGAFAGFGLGIILLIYKWIAAIMAPFVLFNRRCSRLGNIFRILIAEVTIFAGFEGLAYGLNSQISAIELTSKILSAIVLAAMWFYLLAFFTMVDETALREKIETWLYDKFPGNTQRESLKMSNKNV